MYNLNEVGSFELGADYCLSTRELYTFVIGTES